MQNMIGGIISEDEASTHASEDIEYMDDFDLSDVKNEKKIHQ
jgi:hypothetical protein